VSDARALYRAAFQHFVAGRIDEAIDGFRRAVEADPRLSLAWNGLSQAYRRRGDLPRAIEAAERLAVLEPDDPLSHTNLSILYQSAGRIADAEAAKARASQLQAGGRP
jgi:tetratricopeptide (TPR) repeat protein